MSDSSSRRLAPAEPVGKRNWEDAMITAPTNRSSRSACLECKSRKTKCVGGYPCDNCRKRKTECHFDENSDLRRKAALEEKLKQLERNNLLLQQLLQTIREADKSIVLSLLDLIQDKASLEDIRIYVGSRIGQELPNRSSRSKDDRKSNLHIRQAQSRASQSSLKIHRLIDQPLFNVTANPWSRVTKDDAFVSHLVSLWFTWHQPLFNWVDRELFIRDMQSRNLNSLYCSPFLVNAILANACPYSDYPEACSIPGDLSSRGDDFYEEAKYLYDREEGRLSLTTLQGLAILWNHAKLMGKSRNSWVYMAYLAFEVPAYCTAYSTSRSKFNVLNERLQDAISKTAWGISNSTIICRACRSKIPQIRAPHTLKRMTCHGETNDSWISYPSPGEQIEAHTGCVFNSLCDLNIILSEFSPLKEGEEEETRELMIRLQTWFEDLPSCIRDNGRMPPHILSLFLYYHALNIRVLSDLHRLSYVKGDGTIYDVTTEKSIASSAREMAHLIQIHHSIWGHSRMSGFNIQVIDIAMHALIKHLNISQDQEAFNMLALAQRELGSRWLSAKETFESTSLSGVALPVQDKHS